MDPLDYSEVETLALEIERARPPEFVALEDRRNETLAVLEATTRGGSTRSWRQ